MRNAALPLVSLLACALAVACDPVQPDRPGGSGADLTVTQIQNVADPAYPGVGARVALRDVLVIAVDTYDEDGEGRVGNVWVAEPDGGAWSGVQLFAPAVIPSRISLVPGDIVEAVGTLDEFAYMIDDDFSLTELTDSSVQKIGETLPFGATTIPEADLADRARAERWEGCLVRIENVTITGPYDDYDETSTAGGVDVASDLYRIPEIDSGVLTFRALSGVVSYFRPASFLLGVKLLPRGPQDVEL